MILTKLKGFNSSSSEKIAINELSIICESFNNSRFLPHKKIARKINFIKINEIKSNPLKLLPITLRIISCFLKEQYIIVAPLLLSPLIVFYLPLKIIKKNKVILDTSHVGWENDTYPIELGPLKIVLKFLWFLFIKNLKIRAINKPAYDFLKDYTKKIALIPHCVDTTVFYPNPKIKKNRKFTVLFVGKIMYKKGVDLIIEAAKKMKNCDFWLVGKGNYEEEVKKADLKNIKLLGYIKNKHKLNKIYNKCHCLVLPSRKYKGWEELFGIVIIEAMAAGVPVIASDCVGPREIIESKKDGILFEKENLNGLINSIIFFKNDKKLRKKLIKNAYKKITDKYDIKKTSKKLLTLIQTR